MSKSLGNFWTTRDVLKSYHPDSVRYFFHTTLYRNPITYSLDKLEEATNRVEYLYTTVQRIEEALARGGFDKGETPPEADWVSGAADTLTNFWERFDEAMADDFNTPRTLALIGEVAKIGNELTQSKAAPSAEATWTLWQVRNDLLEAGEVLGILARDPAQALDEIRALRLEAKELDSAEIDALVAAREQARADKDWARADEIRDQLDALGVEIMDSPGGSTWRMK